MNRPLKSILLVGTLRIVVCTGAMGLGNTSDGQGEYRTISMLRATILSHPTAAVDYFTTALSVDDYYAEKREVAAVWEGKTAERLGLAGTEVTKVNFSALMFNEHPHTGERLTVRNVSNRRAGVDYTFSAPKSVSVLLELTGDRDILQVEQQAVRAAMAEVQRDMTTQAINAGGSKYYQRTGNLIYAVFQHRTARPVTAKKEGKTTYIPDPQLHSHVIIPNVTFNPEKGRYQAIEEGSVRQVMPYYEAVYHSHLSNGLRELGYSIERTKDRFEVKGVSKAVRDKFSKRTAEIEELAAEKGITDAKTKAELGARTRNKKNQSVADSQLYQLWKDRLSESERVAVHAAKGRGKGSAEKISAKQAVDLSIQHFLERHSAIAEKRVVAQALHLGYGELSLKKVQQELAGRENILRSERQAVTYMTTKEMVTTEERVIERAAQGKGKVPPLNSEYTIKNEVLNEQQCGAIQTLLRSNDRIQILRGAAGVGKTTLLQEVRDGAQEGGRTLLAVAPSANASRNVLRSKGFKDSDTIASLLMNEELQQRLQGNVLLVDEAGQVGLREMDKLIQLAEKQNARVILSGDTKQHNSPAAGSPLQQLQDHAGLRVADVRKIVRQKDETYRKAVEKLVQGRTAEGFTALDKMGVIHEIEDKGERHARIASEYAASIRSKQSSLIISPTHREGEELSKAIRHELKGQGLLGAKDTEFETLRNLSLTESKRQERINYEEDLVVRFHQNHSGGFRAGKYFRVLPNGGGNTVRVRALDTQVDHILPLDAVEKFQLYQSVRTPVAVGEHIKITENSKTLEGTKIHNGQTYRVKSIAPSGDILLSNGKNLAKDHRSFKHAYVETSHASQGKDAQRVIIAQSAESIGASNEKQFYVSVSRGSRSVSVYTDNKEELKKAVLRGGDKITAKEIADAHHARELSRKRKNDHRQRQEQTPTHGPQRSNERRRFEYTVSPYHDGPDK